LPLRSAHDRRDARARGLRRDREPTVARGQVRVGRLRRGARRPRERAARDGARAAEGLLADRALREPARRDDRRRATGLAMEPTAYLQFEQLEASHWWFRGRRTVYLGLLRHHLAGRRLARVLDLGCGVGGFLPGLSEVGARVLPTDVS